MLALVIGILGVIFGTERAERELVAALAQVYPSATGQEARLAREVVQGHALSLGVGLVGTLLSVSAIHGSIDAALARVLGAEGKRPLVRGRLEALGFVAAVVVLASISVALTYGPAVLVGSGVLGLPVGFAFFYLVYRVIPRRRVGRAAAAEAALVSAVLWEVAKLAFGFFARAVGVFAAYGPLALAAGLLTWIYLTAVIILIGAEVVKTRGAA
jgi:membrane protein